MTVGSTIAGFEISRWFAPRANREQKPGVTGSGQDFFDPTYYANLFLRRTGGPGIFGAALHPAHGGRCDELEPGAADESSPGRAIALPRTGTGWSSSASRWLLDGGCGVAVAAARQQSFSVSLGMQPSINTSIAEPSGRACTSFESGVESM